MKQRLIWLLALSSILMLCAPCLAGAASSGSLEVGGVVTDVKDNTARANEYVDSREDDGINLVPELSLESVNGNSAFDMHLKAVSADNFSLTTDFDIARIFRMGVEMDAFQHWKDKETLGQLGATMFGDVGGQQPRVGTNLTGTLGADYATIEEAQAQYYEEQSNDYLITRREWKNEADLQLPQLPNIVFHAGIRIEERDGMEQSITLSKCNACHIEAEGKDIHEKTKDVTFGLTGKFGKLTVEYEYLNRQFDDDSSLEEYNYLTSGFTRDGVVDDDQLLYSGENEYSGTPDSDKDSHSIKARYDLTSNTILTGSFVQADIESEKENSIDDGSTYTFESSNTLESEYTGYTGKISTRLGALRLSARANIYEIDGPEYTITFTDRSDIEVDPYEVTQDFESAESREVGEFGLDAVYRLTRGTTVRLGYEFEEVDRDEEELGETETHTIKASVNSRLSRKLSLRGSYEYQDINDPFYVEDGTGIGQISGTSAGDGAMVLTTDDFRPDNDFNTTVYYWNSVYPNRELDATNQPEEVHEFKGSANWSPAANLSATVSARVRQEENDAVEYKQTTYVPGVSLWYAPNGKMNLTMAYTFNKQETENRMCVGWYHG